jgi:hypothetical protein
VLVIVVRCRALTVAGLKRVAVGEQTRTKVATGTFGEMLGIDNEHDHDSGRPMLSEINWLITDDRIPSKQNLSKK